MRDSILGARVACVALAFASAALEGKATAEGRDYGPPTPPFGEWTALGSGCHGGKAGGGDAVEEIVASPDPLVWHLRFHLDAFHLKTAERAQGAPLTFARECGIRVVVAPPRGSRLVFVGSRARVISRKSPGAKLTLSGDLRLGPESLGSRVVTYEVGEALSSDEAFEFGPGSSTPMPLLDGGDTRIAALDLTWMVRRDSPAESAVVELAPATAEIEIRLARG
jgi:hypothetical protein